MKKRTLLYIPLVILFIIALAAFTEGVRVEVVEQHLRRIFPRVEPAALRAPGALAS